MYMILRKGTFIYRIFLHSKDNVSHDRVIILSESSPIVREIDREVVINDTERATSSL